MTPQSSDEDSEEEATDDTGFVATLTSLISEARISREALALAAGLGKDTVGRWLRGEIAHPQPTKVRDVEQVLDERLMRPTGLTARLKPAGPKRHRTDEDVGSDEPTHLRILPIIKIVRAGHPPGVLTYYSTSWDAQLFYNTRWEGDIRDKIVMSAVGVFDVDEADIEVDIDEGRVLVVVKRSEDPAAKGKVFAYRYWVQPTVVRNLPASLVSGGRYRSSTRSGDGYDYQVSLLANLKLHSGREMLVNGDEIRFVSDTFGGNSLHRVTESSTRSSTGSETDHQSVAPRGR